jgi:hypothetical protein
MRWFSTILVVAAFTLNAKVVFKTADGNLGKLKAIADYHAVYDDAILHFLERLALTSADEIANAGKCVKCLNDAGPAFKTAVQAAGGSLAKAMDDVAVLIKGGTNAAERIDPGALATLLQDVVRVISGSPNYKITQFVDDIAILYTTNQGITGIFGPGGVGIRLAGQIKNVSATFNHAKGELIHLQEDARLTRQGGASVVTQLDAKAGRFWDIVTADGRCFEVKFPWKILQGSLGTNQQSKIINRIIGHLRLSGVPDGKAFYILGDLEPKVPSAIKVELNKALNGLFSENHWIETIAPKAPN